MVIMGWLVAVCVAIVAAWAYTDLRDLRTVARELQIRVEEAQAWADEFERERDVLAARAWRRTSGSSPATSSIAGGWADKKGL
jgi:hypothetical protein